MLERIKTSENEAGLVYEMHIGGSWLAAAGGATFESCNPSDGSLIAHVPDARQTDVDAAISSAAAAQAGWAALPPAARAGLLHRAASLFVERQ